MKTLLLKLLGHNPEILDNQLEMLRLLQSKAEGLQSALRERDKLLETRLAEIKSLSDSNAELAATVTGLGIHIREKDKKIERLQSDVKYFEDRQRPEYEFEVPQQTVEDLKKAMKTIDAFSASILIDYLKHDAIEIVKNLAKVTNGTNAAETIAYRDGALSRIEAMIKILKDMPKTTFNNKIVGQVEAIKRQK